MKSKYIITLLTAFLLISPVAAFWHPPEAKVVRPAFALAINGVMSEDPSDRINFTEPEFGYCSTFTVEVWILGVEDLYGYEFIVYGTHWDTLFTLVGYKYEEFQDALWGAGNWFAIFPAPDYDLSKPYRQAVTAKKPAVGTPLGNYKLAELTFHFIDDVCWCEEDIIGHFDFELVKASDSCSSEIDICDIFPVYWRFIPVQPKVYLTPVFEENCVVGDTFIMKVMIENVVKMKSLHFNLTWHGNHIVNTIEDVWIKMLCTDEDHIVVNPDLFGDPADYTLTIDLYNWGTAPAYYYTSGIIFDLVMACDLPLINQTDAMWAVEITFTKQDPWYCGRQPKYTLEPPHDWIADNATTDIYFWLGYIDVLCPEERNIWFGRYFGPEGSTKGIKEVAGYYVADFDDALYIFDPVEGDLDGDGEVTMADLRIIAQYYDGDWSFVPDGAPSTALGFYYDLNKNSIVDIFDIVIVAKHFGDKGTEHTIP